MATSLPGIVCREPRANDERSACVNSPPRREPPALHPFAPIHLPPSTTTLSKRLLRRRPPTALRQLRLQLSSRIAPLSTPTTSGQQLAPERAHALLGLGGGVRLVLAIREREGDADEQGRGGDGPDDAAAQAQRAPRQVRRGAQLGRYEAARRCRDDVPQREEALGERLVCDVVLGVGRDFRVCDGRGLLAMGRGFVGLGQGLDLETRRLELRTRVCEVLLVLLGRLLRGLEVLVRNLE